MNGTGLAFVAILIIVLIMVAVGAQQMQAQQALDFKNLMDQRDQALVLANDANQQRSAAVVERDEIKGKFAAVEGELNQTARLLKDAEQRSFIQEGEIARLSKERAELQAQLVDLESRYSELQQKLQVANSHPQNQTVPVTGQEDPLAELAPKPENFSDPVRISLVLLVGMAAIGGGGLVVYYHDPERKYAIKMTRAQIKEYSHYQREMGKRGA